MRAVEVMLIVSQTSRFFGDLPNIEYGMKPTFPLSLFSLLPQASQEMSKYI